MTTIVFDGYVLAADRRSTKSTTTHECIHCGEETADGKNVENKIIVPKKSITFKGEKILAMAAAGSSTYRTVISKLVPHLDDLADIVSIAMDLSPIGKHQVEFIILTDENCYKISISNGVKSKKIELNKDTFIAIGSGSLVAKVGHREFNLKAKESIEFASKYDSHTSKESTTYVFREYPNELTIGELRTKVEKAVQENSLIKLKKDLVNPVKKPVRKKLQNKK